MMTDEELRNQYRSSAADEAQRLRIGADNPAERLAELQAAGLRAVYNAGLDRAREIARTFIPDPHEPDESCEDCAMTRALAAAIEAEKGQS